MKTIRDLFDKSKPIDRRIEKVITYDTTSEELLKREIQEYVATESIEQHFDRFLDRLDEGMGSGATTECGVWVSGFYGSGKSSFTKYLGFAFDPTRLIEGKPFVEWLQNQFKSKSLRARLATAAKKWPSAVIMLDLASEQLAGATMAEISSVLYAKVMQWAGYSRDEKIAYLEFMLEKDGKLDAFQKRIAEVSHGKTWAEIRNQPLAIKALASKVAPEFYPELFPDSKTFNEIKIEEKIKEDDRVKQMLDLIKRRSSKDSLIFILDEVGNYVVARDDLILNLDGLAKNIKNQGLGHAWIIATAQQTLTEDDPRAALNTAKLFKLKDRFPVSIDLEASDIKEICYNRLLGKSTSGEDKIKQLFDSFGPQLRHAIDLKEAPYYKAELTKETFCRYYPFLPHHFDILLQLLARLAKSRGGIGLRSAIKVIQDVLVDSSGVRKGQKLLADEPVGILASAVSFYDTLKADIEKPYPHIIAGVEKAKKVFGEDSMHVRVAKTVAILQILEDFPVSRENVAALLHPAVDSPSFSDGVSKAVAELLTDKSVPLSEVDNSLRFMSEKVLDLEKERQGIVPRSADSRNILNAILAEIFTPAPSVKLNGTRTVSTGLKIMAGSSWVSLTGDKDPIQTHIEFVKETVYEKQRLERIHDSQQKPHAHDIFLIGHEDPDAEGIVFEIFRCREIFRQHRNKATEKEVDEYLRAQSQRADSLQETLSRRLRKAIAMGSFIFRGKPRPVTELGSDILGTAKAFLEEAASQVFDKYSEAPVQADSNTAERFLKTENLKKITASDDPLSLVKKGSGPNVIDATHKAVISIREYLENHGQVEGRKLLDDFYAPRYGWSKDTTRYIVAAMLTAGIVKLRVSGEDITVRGDTAIASIKNTQSFNKIGIALRDAPVDLSMLSKARDRLLSLTGQDILPLEEEISKCVMRHFPDFQHDYASLAIQLKNLGLQGVEKAQEMQDSLAEILKGDASDAATRLGGVECPLCDDLVWARKVQKAFNNGIDQIVAKGQGLLSSIPGLPLISEVEGLLSDTQELRHDLAEYIGREDFYDYMPDMQNRISGIETKVASAAKEYREKLVNELTEKKKALMSLPEWLLIGSDDRIRLGAEMDALTFSVTNDVTGLQKLFKDQVYISSRLSKIEAEIKELGIISDPGRDEHTITEEIVTPKKFSSMNELNDFITTLEQLRDKLSDGVTLIIKWK